MTCFSAERDMKVNSGHGTKLRPYRQCLLFFIALAFSSTSFAQYRLHLVPVDKDSVFLEQLALRKQFPNKNSCLEYLGQLPDLLAKKGYASASVDSILEDSIFTTVHLFVGEQYYWGQLKLMASLPQNYSKPASYCPRKTTAALQPAGYRKIADRLTGLFGRPWLSFCCSATG